MIELRVNLCIYTCCKILYILYMHLCLIQDYIIAHNRQHVIELDANLTPLELFKVGVSVLYVHDLYTMHQCMY